jgi:hypothetical protein
VNKVVLLAMDRVYNCNGEPMPVDESSSEKTHCYISNEYVASIASDNSGKVLFGASIHMDRLNVEQYLEHAKDCGADLVKWLPSAQSIDPLRKTYRSFDKNLWN